MWARWGRLTEIKQPDKKIRKSSYSKLAASSARSGPENKIVLNSLSDSHNVNAPVV